MKPKSPLPWYARREVDTSNAHLLVSEGSNLPIAFGLFQEDAAFILGLIEFAEKVVRTTAVSHAQSEAHPSEHWLRHEARIALGLEGE